MTNQKIILSVVIITKNEERNIKDCINSVLFSDEIIVVDSESTDKTVEIAKKCSDRVKVFTHKFKDFSTLRDFAQSKASGKWILFVDADERVSQELKTNIINVINNGEFSTFKIKRKNFYFGNYEWPTIEKLERLFLKEKLKGWYGLLHESPRFEGNLGELNGFLNHYTHRTLSEMVEKTNEWSEIESEILFSANHPKMVWWRFLRIILTKFWDSFFKQKGYKLGTVGLIESIFQAFSYFIVYAKLWEKQQVKLKAQSSNAKTKT